MTGLDMLLSTALKAMGFNKEVVEKEALKYADRINTHIKDFDLRFKRMEENQRLIMLHLGIAVNVEIGATDQPAIEGKEIHHG